LSETLEQKAAHRAQIASDRNGLESALRAEESCEVVLDTTHRGSVDFLRLYRDATQTTQEAEQLPNGGCIAAPRSRSTSAMLQK
jgi:hypothetical protein